MKKIIIVLLIIAGNNIFAGNFSLNPFVKQDSTEFKSSFVWGDIGVQFGFAKNIFDKYNNRFVIGHNINLNYLTGSRRFAKLRYSSLQRLVILGSEKQKYKTYEIGLMSGKLLSFDLAVTEFSIGLSVVGGAKEEFDPNLDEYGGDYIFSEYLTLGIPFEISGYLYFHTSQSALRIGLTGNINPHYSYIMLQQSIVFGNPKK